MSKKAKVTLVGLQKGGTGKTTVTSNLAYALAQEGKRVLVIDFDAQADFSVSLGVDDPHHEQMTIAKLVELEMEQADFPDSSTFIRSKCGIDFICGSKSLSALAIIMQQEPGSDLILKYIVDRFRSLYDYILIDTGPNEGKLSMNAMCAADSVLIPMEAQCFSMTGVREFLTNIRKTRRGMNTKLTVDGIVFNKYEKRTAVNQRVFEDIQTYYGESIYIYQTIIPKNASIATAQYVGEPVGFCYKYSVGSKSFKNLALEYLAKNESEAAG